MGEAWWQNRPLRIYHPNAREFELANFDTDRFIYDCVKTHAEAVVISAGGIYAFYRSKIPNHYISPVMGDRDLLLEITEMAHDKDLKVIARFDFSKAREEVYSLYPDWFQRAADGQPYMSTAFYVTCPTGGYQNEGFAHKALREVFEDYGVDGVHINAGGFHNYCYCNNCRSAFGRHIPADPQENPDDWKLFIQWRQQAIAEEFAGYYRVMKDVNPDAFLMAELAGEEYPHWSHNAGYELGALRNAFSQMLLTSGGMTASKKSRWWVGMSADKVYAVDQVPIINIKMQMRDRRLTNTNVPSAEFLLYSYQAIAHGAGLKLATFGIPRYLADKRTIPDIIQVFGFMKEQQEVLDSMKPMGSIALVYPEHAMLKSSAMEGKNAEILRDEFVGLYNALKIIHCLTGVIIDADISLEAIRKYETVIFPTTAWLSDDQAEAVADFVGNGGNAIILDCLTSLDGSCYPIPQAISNLLDCAFGNTVESSNYLVPETFSELSEAAYISSLPLTQPYRKFKAGSSVQVLFKNSSGNDPVSPEEFLGLTAGENPIIVRAGVGSGQVIYAGTGLSKMILDIGHSDYYSLLEGLITSGLKEKRAILIDAPSSVEANLSRWRNGLVVHLVNSSGLVPLDKPVRVGPVTIDIAGECPKRITLHRPGEKAVELDFSFSESGIKIVVPYLDIYAMVIIYRD